MTGRPGGQGDHLPNADAHYISFDFVQKPDLMLLNVFFSNGLPHNNNTSYPDPTLPVVVNVITSVVSSERLNHSSRMYVL